MKTIGTGRFETQPAVSNFAGKLQESVSKLSACELITKFSARFIFANEIKNNEF